MKLTLTFVGSGPTLQACREFVREHGLESCVEFRREVTHEKLADFYRGLDLFVLPSYFEGFGCVFTEAWACGTPFVTCEGQGMDDLIPKTDRGTWLCRPRDPDDLAAKIRHVVEARPAQTLTGPIDIDTLVARFVDEIERL